MTWELRNGEWYRDGIFWGQRYELMTSCRVPDNRPCKTCGRSHNGPFSECGCGGREE